VSKILDLIGTTANTLRIAIGGVLLKNSSGNLLVRNTGDTADAEITTSRVNVSGDNLVINSDAANSSADRSITLSRPTSGMSASYTLTLPTSAGSPGQVLQTDGSGNLSFTSVAGTSDKITTDTTNLAFGSSTTVSMFTLPANAVVQAVRVIIDTAFNGNPSMSVGISGNTSKYLASTQVDLKAVSTTIFEVYPGLAPVGTTEALQIAYTAGSATAGAARVEVDYAVPS
jgi:hypothetical protein